MAFLYHPCTPLEQVDTLKSLARSCLWRHIVTPYPHLTTEKVGKIFSLTWFCNTRAQTVVTVLDLIKLHNVLVVVASSCCTAAGIGILGVYLQDVLG